MCDAKNVKLKQLLAELNEKDTNEFDEELKKTHEKHGGPEQWQETKKQMLTALHRRKLILVTESEDPNSDLIEVNIGGLETVKDVKDAIQYEYADGFSEDCKFDRIWKLVEGGKFEEITFDSQITELIHGDVILINKFGKS